MKQAIPVIIQEEGLFIYHPQNDGKGEFVAGDGTDCGERLLQFCARQGISYNTVILFAAESLLFFKQFELPGKNIDLEEAIGYQLGLLTPFDPQDVYYAYSATKDKENHLVTLYAVAAGKVLPYLEGLNNAGFNLLGLYPESQRYVTKTKLPATWAMLYTSDQWGKVFVFNGQRLVNRLVCPSRPLYADLVGELGIDCIYHPDPLPESGFTPARALAFEQLALKEFNLLPPSYRRPEYTRRIILALLIINVLIAIAFVGIKEYHVRSANRVLTDRIAAIKPQLEEVRRLKDQEQNLAKYVENFTKMTGNPDIISLLKKLSEELPHSAYLNQISQEKDATFINIRGYANDVSELTTRLQNMGNARLKSTSRRKDKTYFDVEIGLP